ncbi:hypothetical protein [Capnocytophaga catalasegens]|nr:hypothetical protein [Capnocytophaga catalasegens]
MGLFSFFFACEKAEDIYVYGTDDFNKKEKSLNINLKQAFEICKLHINNTEKHLKLSIIYGDYYIFYWGEVYNPKIGYNLSGIWVNGENGEIKTVKTEKYINIGVFYIHSNPPLPIITDKESLSKK